MRANMFKKLPLFILFLLLSGLAVFWLFFKGQPTFTVSEVIDGDTIRLADGTEVRYLMIDTPEPEECYSEKAKEINQQLVEGKKVRIETDLNEMDRFGRTLAYVYLQDNGKEVFVNEYLLEEGAAIFFLDTVNLKYQERLVEVVERAHAENKGLWYFCAPDPELGCQIKGNLDKLDHRWYHLPSFRHYDQVKVNLDHGDRWFCTEEEAITAGFKRARE